MNDVKRQKDYFKFITLSQTLTTQIRQTKKLPDLEKQMRIFFFFLLMHLTDKSY